MNFQIRKIHHLFHTQISICVIRKPCHVFTGFSSFPSFIDPVVACFNKALAEELHERVRKEFWGYSNEEELQAKDLHMIKYQVIHSPSPGESWKLAMVVISIVLLFMNY